MSDSQSPPEWPVQSSERIHEYEMFSVVHDRARSPENGELHDRHVVDSPDGVAVLAFTADGKVVLVEQYRHGVRRLSLELPSGIVDEGEEPIQAGLRELREETGFAAEEGVQLGTLALNPSWQTTRVHVVLARKVTQAGEKDLDAGEDTRVRQMPWQEVMAEVRDGGIDSAVALAALLLYTSRRDSE